MFFTAAVPNLFGTRDWFHGRQLFQGRGRGRWFQDVSSTLHWLRILLLLLLHQLRFRSPGIRPWRLGTPVLQFRLKPYVLSSPLPGRAALIDLQNFGRVWRGVSQSLCEESEPWGWEHSPGTLVAWKSCHYCSEGLELYDTSCSTVASCEVGIPLDSPSCRDLFPVTTWSCGSY